MANALTLKNISKSFENLTVLSSINLEVREGEFFIFVGPSGAGKSTILRIMSGLEKDYSGSVTLGSNLMRQDISFVFQQFALLPWLTVYQNIEIGLFARDLSESERRANVHRELNRLGLEKFAHVYPRELSGGMRQRAGVARALATDPKIIFMDEPFSELDSFTADELRKEVLDIWQERKPTIVMVTHIVEDALELGDRVAVLTPRPASIESIVVNGLARPRKKRSESFYALADRLYKLIKP